MKHFKGTVTFMFDSYAESDDDLETRLMLALDDIMATDEDIDIDKYGADIKMEEIENEND